jgi:DNA-directed RNA polymerase specialized sigma24 family protein
LHDGLSLPDGVDRTEYDRLRRLMWASVQRVWRGDREVVAGTDPWSVVDEAWTSMAANDFRCAGPFPVFACRVARNKAIDALKRAEVRRLGPSLDATRPDDEGNEMRLVPLEASTASAEAEFFDAERLAGITQAIEYSLTKVEKMVFLAVRVDRKSGAAVGRELDPPLSGQRVGQILAGAVVKIHDSLRALEDEHLSRMVPEPAEGKGGR